MEFLKNYLQIIEKEIVSLSLPNKPSNLYSPIEYFMSLGGKRIRPILALMGYKLFDSNIEKAIPIAKMVELFHNFSLIHDDIMDEAPIRRGKATIHEKWNENIAILSGDMVLIKAYQELEGVDNSYKEEILKVFNMCAVKVCEGQQHDMDFELRDNVTVNEYINMIYLKTSALLEHSLEMGAIVAGANDNQRKNLSEFGKNLGIAFQLRDDLLDVFSTEDFGKQKAGDIISNKKTYLMLKALEKANNSQKKELNLWLNKTSFDDNEKVNAVTKIYKSLHIEDETNKMISHYTQLATNALDNLSDVNNQAKNEFYQLQEYLMNRTV